MKKTINYILAAVAVFAAASCQKFETVKNVEETNAPVRTLTAVFEEGSKTTASSDGETTYAIWAEGDVIRVMDTEEHAANHTVADGEISEDGKKVTFDVPAEVTGEQIYAIHGDNAATTSNAGVISFTIPATQDGTFNTANICVAKADENGTLTFKNATAIVHITNPQTAGGNTPNTLTFTSSNGIVGDATATFDPDFAIACTGNIIQPFTITSDNSSDEFYFAIAAGTYSSIIAQNNNGKKSLTIKDNISIVRSKIYTIDASKISFKNN